MDNSKRICTITHHTVPNYGAVLQTYALQKAILNLGVESEVLNYDSERVKNTYPISIKEVKNIKQLVKYIAYPAEKKRKRKINEFVKKHVKVSDKVYKRNELYLSNDIYDLFITGSDQVWNLNIHKGDTSYMLDFVNDSSKKGSYAASFGYGDIPEQFKEDTISLLKSFNYYNLRERQGQDILKKYLNKESNLVLDPTLLLTKEDYKPIIDKVHSIKKYVLIYNITKSESLVEFAKKLANEKGLEVIAINSGYKRVSNCKNILDAAPEEFLGYFMNAEYIVTSSFHGMAFSVIFNKEFFYELNKKGKNNNSRLENMAELFGVKNREIITGNEYNTIGEIDYIKVNNIVKNERNKSLGILKNMIDN